ncbi:MAG TPA: hypothetical protein VLI21_14975, partial [Casimicrobiaceae bacterium]|nr:hypothetical protein [Casimicrobiaceae bacterium]
LWMRALSLAGVPFSALSIGAPVVMATLALAWTLRRRASDAFALVLPWRRQGGGVRTATLAEDLRASRRERYFIYAIAAWLVLRFVVLLLDVIWTPLYPWDAWIQWATKARVWYSLGHIVPFGRSEAWFAANGAMWLDASPDYPATVPLWQVWSSVALGRFDDALMNIPWWLTAVALAIAVFGALRAAGMSSATALVGAWLVSSLPLANVHVALAGYADLPMAAYYALAALSVWRWSGDRTLGNLTLALLFAIACVTIKTPGIVWASTLLPAVVVTLMPQRGPRIVLVGFIAVLLVLAALAQMAPVVLGYRLHLDFAPAWRGLIASLFVFGNWHLLWYAVIAVIVVGWSEIRTTHLIALSMSVAAGALFLVVVFSFTNARNWVTDQTTINRALLHMAPLALIWTMLVAHAWFVRVRGQAPASEPTALAASA